jgi:2-oxo-4-hydroxy-4-carboxy-5-ureidoimidazoline decarboxylase
MPCGGISRLRAIGRAIDVATAPRHPGLRRLDELGSHEANAAFLRCCGSTRWAKRMVEARPFWSETALFGTAEQEWWRLGERDFREAFSHHPEIGSDLGKLRERFAATSTWSSREQAAVATASDATLKELEAANRDYREHFGYVFLVCATGKSAEEMLSLLHERMSNPPENELRVAAGQQAKITRIRLAKLIHEICEHP